MNKKYFETKSGSLEEISTKIATEQPTITKEAHMFPLIDFLQNIL